LENSRLFEQAVNSRNFLQNVLRSVKNLVVAFDEKGYVTTFNHSIERYFGVTESTISRQKFSSWLADYPALVQDIEQCMESEEELEGLPIEVENSEGEAFEMSYTVSPLTFAVKGGGDGSEASKPASAASLAAGGGVAGGSITPRRRGGSTEDRDSRKSQPSAQVRGCVVVFDDMTESKLMKATLGRYLNPALVAEVLKSGSDTLGGVRQKVTVLFSDIRSFTSISERMDASDLVAMLNEYFTWEIPPIFDNHGVSRADQSRKHAAGVFFFCFFFFFFFFLLLASCSLLFLVSANQRVSSENS
jgi:adenylate cyclase